MTNSDPAASNAEAPQPEPDSTGAESGEKMGGGTGESRHRTP